MTAGVRVAVLGNCQAGPFSSQLRTHLPHVEIDRVITVHLARDEDRDEAYAALDKVDLILAQRVADNYPCRFVRNLELRLAFGDKVLVWPNLYFRGYNPELTYVRSPENRVVSGPFGDYHLSTIHAAWQAGLPVAEAVASAGSVDHNRELFADVPAESLRELQEREADCDVVISDWLALHAWERRAFFTFNHPTRHAISVLTERMIARLDLAGDATPAIAVPASTAPEPLGRFRLPVNPWIGAEVAPHLSDGETFLGNDVEWDGGLPRTGKQIRALTLPELAESYYRVYDQVFSS